MRCGPEMGILLFNRAFAREFVGSEIVSDQEKEVAVIR